MPEIVISTVGTSLLTNQIDRHCANEQGWFAQLKDCANDRFDRLSPVVMEIVSTLSTRARARLNEANIAQIRRLSAELNGIYGLYAADLSRGKTDIHYLIATDTAQGQTTAEILADFLRERGIVNINIKMPKGLSTSSTNHFAAGVDDLITWLELEIMPIRSKYQVSFNLVGGFKSLQGYLNTLGMFYADKIIYIFEGESSELITIPRLPISIDLKQLQPHTVKLALLAEGDGLPRSDIIDIPEGLVAPIDDRYLLSSWGLLIWQRTKQELLGDKLLDFPGLAYQDKFRADFDRTREPFKRVKLQETLARVSYLLTANRGSTQALVGGGLQYAPLVGQNIDHFRITQDLRVTCRPDAGTLILYRYGEHQVNESPV